jgi:beta-lactamase
MVLDKIIDELSEEYTAKSVHANKKEVMKVLMETGNIIRKNKDSTPEEIVNAIIDDCATELNQIIQTSSVPGIVSSLQVDNININLYGRKIGPNGEPLRKEALFDVASISKFYTDIIAYKLINEGAFKLSDKIQKLDSRFENVGDLNVSDVLKFLTTFKTNGRIEDVNIKSEAEERLFTMEVVEKGEEYNYNDMGLMLIKEVMEKVTGKKYNELFEEYIIKPYLLYETHLIVPEEKIHLVTGTPNMDGSVNDIKANVLGGYSGHAGVRITSDDLIKLGQAINRDYELKNGLYVPNDKMKIRSEKIGNAYLNTEIHIKKDGTVISGKETSYFGALAPSESLAIQGSTRVLNRSSNFNDIDINSTALSNISSLTDE